MGRPKGSKNKPKEPTLWQHQKESNPPTASIVEKPEKKERKKRIDTTTLPQEESEDSSCGMESVAPATMPTEDKSGLKTSTSILKGWVTINISPATWWKSKTYYTGGDIHDTREAAMRVTASARVGVAYIECEVKI